MWTKPEDSKLLKDSKGRWRIRSLFWEMVTPAQRKEFVPPYTLKEEDFTNEEGTFVSARAIYLAAKDPTEYEAAMALLGSWEHWKKLLEVDWFVAELTKWREELEIALKSEAIAAMRLTAKTEGSKGTAAAKFIAQGGWEEKKGRPSKAAVEKEARIQARIHDELDDDIERMKKELRH